VFIVAESRRVVNLCYGPVKREERGKNEGRKREEKVGIALSGTLSHSVFPSALPSLFPVLP
jgi:hypothetical protein